MKKVLLMVVAVAMMLSACSKSLQTIETSADVTITKAAGQVQSQTIAAEDGNVTSWSATALPNGICGSDPFKVGKFSGIENKAILSFNTASIPDLAVIDDVYLWISIARASDGGRDDVYVGNYMKFEIAAAAGFGGSTTLTYLDYSALANYGVLYKDMWIDPAIGGTHFPAAAFNYINKFGKTQIRVGFTSNPTNQAYNLCMTADTKIMLIVNYH